MAAIGLAAGQTCDYRTALKSSVLFYQAQKSGRTTGGPVPWRVDTFLNDGSDVGMDLSGGFFDAGDHVIIPFICILLF